MIIMKKLKSLIAVILMAMTTFTFTSCDEDEYIADTLWGVWEGDMYAYYDYNGYRYQSSKSVLAFDHDPYSYASGSGYWIDYYSNAPYDYYASRITWTVQNQVIKIWSIEEDKDYYISDYSLNDGAFHGYIDSGDFSGPIEFHLYKTASPDWSDYDWNGWGYYDYSYYAPSKNGVKKASIIDESKPRPTRKIGKPTTE